MRQRFGGKVWRVTVDAGFTCPNVDGSVAVGGCVYCDNRSFSPNRRLPRSTIREQVRRGIALLQKRYGADKFLAYFQAATNTYAPLDKLRRLYDVPVWIDVGQDDPFREADTALAHELQSHGTRVRLLVHGGGHSGWSARMPDYLRFYAGACP